MSTRKIRFQSLEHSNSIHVDLDSMSFDSTHPLLPVHHRYLCNICPMHRTTREQIASFHLQHNREELYPKILFSEDMLCCMGYGECLCTLMQLQKTPSVISDIVKESFKIISMAQDWEALETNLVFFPNEIVQIPFLIDCHIQLLAVIL